MPRKYIVDGFEALYTKVFAFYCISKKQYIRKKRPKSLMPRFGQGPLQHL